MPDDVGDRGAETVRRPAQEPELVVADPDVVAEDAPDLLEAADLDLGVVAHLDDQAAHEPPGEHHLDPLADRQRQPVGDPVVEGAVEVERFDLDHDPGDAERPVRPGGHLTAARSASTRSVRSQVNRSPSRPKWP
jgi:hypothetical protein